MEMRGIDVSNWQSGIKPSTLDVDFCIVKATEGLGYVDPACDAIVTDCINHGLLFGFYHFARENSAKAEAKFFYENCLGYIGHGIPVLDYETNNPDNVKWCEDFAQAFHDLSGIWPMMYLCAGQLWEFRNVQTWLPSKCGLWLAGYPYTMTTWTDDDIPYNISPWPFAAIWQFTSSLIIPGWHSRLDGDIAYMDSSAWMKYAGSVEEQPKPAQKPEKSIDNLALEVVLGEYGTGSDRKKQLGKRYKDVQARVNQLYDIADEVIAGKWGNGWNRMQALDGAGYPSQTVQLIVNKILEG